LSVLLSSVAKYFANQTAAGPKTPESVFPFTLIISSTKSVLPTKVQILRPQAEKVLDMEKNSAHSKSL
jgi:hypothetical protein